MSATIAIDGSIGEGGGQILRTALGLSAVTGRPFRIDRIRAGRAKPGLLRQHLAGVRAVAALCGASVDGDALGSTALSFVPGPLTGGEIRVDIGSAGSCGLVLQALLPLLLRAPRPVRVAISGGTHNDAAPPAPFLEHALWPLLARMGADLALEVPSAGFYPAGGGQLVATARPAALSPLAIEDEGPAEVLDATALVSNLPGAIGRRELDVCRAALALPEGRCRLRTVPSPGPGNAVVIRARRGTVGEVFTGFGRRGVPAEDVAQGAIDAYLAWERAGAPVGEHLADQLLVPMALAGGGRFLTGTPSPHTTTNAQVVARFLPVAISFRPAGSSQVEVRVEARG